MVERPQRRLTYANVMSTIAVFGVLAGGGAWAASKIGADDIKRNAVRSKHIKNGQVKRADVASGVIPTNAYARVSGPGVVTASKGIVSLSHMPGSALYCFDLSFSPRNGVASATADASAGGSTAAIQIPASASCPDGSDANVLTRDGSNMINEQAFFVQFTR